MKKTIYFVILVLFAISCKKNKSNLKTSFPLDSVKEIKSTVSKKTTTTEEVLPIHGSIDKIALKRYFGSITDTIKDLRIIGSEKININPGNNIYVSILHNIATFDEMILCTHDSDLNLIAHFYIGKATMFDVTSHTIEYNIINDNTLKFEHIDWGYIKNNENEDEIGKTNHISYTISINNAGKLTKSNTTIHKLLN